MARKSVAVLAATGMVGQRYVKMLSNHPMFEVTQVTGYGSAGMKYADAVKSRGEFEVDDRIARMTVLPTRPDVIDADIVFSPLPTEAAETLEPRLAKNGLRIITDASPHRMDPDVPLMIPEVNPGHLDLLELQKKKRRWSGVLVATPNCTAAGLALLLKPLDDLAGVSRVIVSTMQAVSGAGYPGVASLDIIDNVVPYIKDEEEKVSSEPLKILGRYDGSKILPARMSISAMCHRVATTDGHMESAYIETEDELDLEEVKGSFENFTSIPQKLRLPSAPKKPIIVSARPDRPQVKLDRYAGSVPGMSVVVGRIRHGLDKKSLRVTFLSHNTIRGAAGSTILAAELMQRKGLLD